jgi:hypothetical protein
MTIEFIKEIQQDLKRISTYRWYNTLTIIEEILQVLAKIAAFLEQLFPSSPAVTKSPAPPVIENTPKNDNEKIYVPESVSVKTSKKG